MYTLSVEFQIEGIRVTVTEIRLEQNLRIRVKNCDVSNGLEKTISNPD